MKYKLIPPEIGGKMKKILKLVFTPVLLAACFSYSCADMTPYHDGSLFISDLNERRPFQFNFSTHKTEAMVFTSSSGKLNIDYIGISPTSAARKFSSYLKRIWDSEWAMLQNENQSLKKEVKQLSAELKKLKKRMDALGDQK